MESVELRNNKLNLVRELSFTDSSTVCHSGILKIWSLGGKMKHQIKIGWKMWATLSITSIVPTLFAWADCDQFQHPQDVLNCTLKQSPVVQQAEAKGVQGKSLTNIAEQRPNPEFDSNIAIGRSQGEGVLNSQVSLSHIFELGGKRGARIEKASAENEIISAEILKSKEETALTTVSVLYRLRQLKAEIATLDEALFTFSQIKNQLKSRPRLTPDQEVALATFQLVESDYRVRKNALTGDEQALIKFLGLATGKPFQVRSELLPQPKESWPDLNPTLEPKQLAGSDMNRLRAEVKHAEAELSLAQSASWPNLKVGPMFQAQTQGGISYQAYGLNLSVPLPLYQANGGGRAYSIAGLSRTEIILKTSGNQLAIEREQEITRYQAALKALQESGTLHDVEKKHQNIERLFKGGLIQSSMVIEAHRQIVELTRNVNEQELTAIRALWRIYAIEGRVLKEKI